MLGMTKSPPDPSFGFLVHDIARLLRKRFEQRARVHGLTRSHWQVLAWLKHCEGINQSGLAEGLDLEPITVGRLIDRMEEAGWVERRSDPADRRAYRLYMTEKAKPMIDRMNEIGTGLRAEAMAGLSDKDLAKLMDMLMHIRSNLGERGEKAVEGAGSNPSDEREIA